MSTLREQMKKAGCEKEYEEHIRNRRRTWAVVLFCGYSTLVLSTSGIYCALKGYQNPLTWPVVLLWLLGGVIFARLMNPHVQRLFDRLAEKDRARLKRSSN